ncbi:hypothetical protein GGS20DRAFT_126447 [Poronia punctata]|nr:hypothetical protein GGS20DRAFT_126447 [Poronia punctata]
MASQFQVQKPYVLTTLPRPLDPKTGAYTVGEVYGYTPGSKKRKRRRAELTVGIDGEAINIYDISSSRLVTSYPIPPQSRISCPASSIRLKSATTKDVTRYTYSASNESKSSKVTLFKDSVDGSGKTSQVTVSTTLGKGSPIVWLGPVSSPESLDPTENSTPVSEVLVIREDGGVACLDGETLRQIWTSTGLAMVQDLPDDARENFTIELCRAVPASEVVKGIFKGNSEVFNILSSSSEGLDEEVEVFVLISSSGATGHRSRHVHFVSRLPSAATSTRAQQGVIQLHVMPLATTHSKQEKKNKPSSYRLDARNGALLELHNGTIIVHDLTASVPKVTSTMQLDGTNSFLTLSRTSLLCSTNTQLSIFNPVYKSLQNTTDIDLGAQGQVDATKDYPCQLVAYFPPLERAISIIGSNLVAVQLEAPKSRHAKRRAEGLLIDSIGRGLPTTTRSSSPLPEPVSTGSVFSNYLPGSLTGRYWVLWTSGQKAADSLLKSDKVAEFEAVLAAKFGLKVEGWDKESPAQNDDNAGPSTDIPNWLLPKSRADYPPVDRRWVLYAISRCFEWNSASPEDTTVPRLICQLPQSNILNYLVDAGHMTLSNLRAAFRDKLGEKEAMDNFLAEQLVERLSEVDPTLELLVVYLSATNLGAQEILLVLKALMKSLELVNSTNNKPLPQLLTSGSAEDITMGDETAENEDIRMELDDLEDEIQKTVTYLNNDDAGLRGRGISVAFSKLGACPSSTAIKALRATFKPDEIVSLMLILRVELVRGRWTDRYVEDNYIEETTTFEAPPDNVIKLIADLLGLCIDSLGPAGWLFNDPLHSSDDTVDFIGSLTHEVSAALVGLNETVYLRNLLADPLKFWESTLKASPSNGEDVPATKPVAVQFKEPGAAALPLGLESVNQRVSSHRVAGGGEIVQRTARGTGHLVSKNVGSYSLERIVI